MDAMMIRVGIVGGTGSPGVELLRLLAAHPQVTLQVITSRADAGTPVSQMFPSLRGYVDLAFTHPDQAHLEQCDLVFFATPNGIAMQQVRALLDAGVKVIDLAADFRLQDVAAWEKWYGMTHACPDMVAEAVYGLPEVNRAQIRSARLVANPGCYPTAVQLGFIPLLEAGVIEPGRLIADAKYGGSGAGREAEMALLLSEQRFADEPCVDGMPAGSHPETRTVRGSNCCRIAVYRPQGGDTVVVLSVIDNLVKGAAGQAVQNMNIMFGLTELAALNNISLLP